MLRSKPPVLIPLAPEAAREKLLTALSRRALTRAEARARLAKWGLFGAAAEDIISALLRSGVLDDRKAAAAFALSRSERGYGWNRIRRELATRGIAARDIEETRQEIAGHTPEEGIATLQRIAESEWRKLARLDPERRRRRWFGRLQRRGFAGEQLMKILRALERQESKNVGYDSQGRDEFDFE